MRKREFLARLRKGLSGLPKNDIEERLIFYSEMIEDRMEEGLSEAEAVLAVGAVDEIVAQAVSENPLSKIAKERMKPQRQLNAWGILLLALGSPIWLSLGMAAFAVVLSLYVSLWVVVISLWSVFVSLIVCALGGLLAGIVFACAANVFSGMAMVGAGIVCAGLSIFMFYACKAAGKAMLLLSRKMAVWMKNCFIRKEAVQ